MDETDKKDSFRMIITGGVAEIVKNQDLLQHSSQ